MNDNLCYVTVSERNFNKDKLKRLAAYNPAGIRFNSGRNSFEWIHNGIIELKRCGYQKENIYIDIGNNKTRIKTDHDVKVIAGDFIKISMKLKEDCLLLEDIIFFEQLGLGDIVLFGDGHLQCSITDISAHSTITLRSLTKGVISNNTAIHIKGKNICSSFMISDFNKINQLVNETGVSLILSFVENQEDIDWARSKFNTKVVPKIETMQAVKNLYGILRHTDVIIIGRGDLSLDVGYEKVGLLENEIIEKAKGYSSVIVATGVLTSLLFADVPTQAEVSDITNKIGKVDGFILTDETAKSEDPFRTIEWFNKIVNAVMKSRGS